MGSEDDLKNAVLIEWIVLNSILIAVIAVLLLKHYQEKKKRQVHEGLLNV